MLTGTVPECNCNDSDGKDYEPKATYSQLGQSQEKKDDAFLATDCISSEKLASSEYNSDVFIFADSAIRKLLADIQIEEQNHAEMLFKYKNRKRYGLITSEVQMRLDKYLKVSRIIKRRTIANEACDAGRVMVNNKTAKASTDVKVGDIIEIGFGNKTVKVEVTMIADSTKKKEDAKKKCSNMSKQARSYSITAARQLNPLVRRLLSEFEPFYEKTNADNVWFLCYFAVLISSSGIVEATLVFAGIDFVTKVFPATTAFAPITVSPPSIVVLA